MRREAEALPCAGGVSSSPSGSKDTTACVAPREECREFCSRFLWLERPAALLTSALGRFAKMDASTLAALSIAMDESRDAALRELLQERERDRMQAEDLRSFVAQRHFTASQLVPNVLRPITWEAAYARRHNDLLLAHDAMRDALLAVRSGNDVRAEMLLTEALTSDEEEEVEEG